LATVRCSATRAAKEGSDKIFQGPAFAAGLFYQMVFSEQSAGILERFRNNLLDKPSFAELDRLAGESCEGARRLELHPAAFRRDVREIFIGRQPFHTLGDQVRAIYEGVAAELARQVSLLSGSDLPPVVIAAGGGARSQLWLDIKSKAIGRPVRAVNCLEPTGRGAAIIALAAIRQRDLPDLACEIFLRSDRPPPEVQHAGERHRWDQ
jgi:sugar (pentulose or hexulose) kinase